MSDAAEAQPRRSWNQRRARHHPPQPARHLNRLQSEDLGELVKLFDRIEADPAIGCWC